MRQLCLIILSLIAPYVCFSTTFEIVTPSQVKAESFVQFRALSTENDRTLDITRECEFRLIGVNARERNIGEFYIKLPFGRESYAYADLQVQCYGETLTRSISIDLSPDRIDIMGPYSLRSGDFSQFYAYGYYGSRRINISHRGNWRAWHGLMSSNGQYRAPYLRNGHNVTDRIQFSMGRSFSYSSVYVRAF